MRDECIIGARAHMNVTVRAIEFVFEMNKN